MKSNLNTVKFIIENTSTNNIAEDLREVEMEADVETREEFNCNNEPLHKYEAYYVGDADEEELDRIATEHGCSDHYELLMRMDRHYAHLVEVKCANLIGSTEPFEVRINGEVKYYAAEGTEAETIEEKFGEYLVEDYTDFPGLISFVSKEVIEE